MEIDIEEFNFNNFQTRLTEARLKRMTESHLFHFTNIEALTNIIKTNTLWATHCQYLNDLMELKDFERLLNDLLKVESEKFQQYINVFFETIYIALFEKLREKTYIISFTKNNDSIPMWRDYGKKGVVLEFDASIMIETIKVDEIIIIDRNTKVKEISTVKRYGDAVYEDTFIVNLFEKSYEIFARLKELKNPEKENEIYDNLVKVLYDTFMACIYRRKTKILHMKKNLGWHLHYKIMTSGKWKIIELKTI